MYAGSVVRLTWDGAHTATNPFAYTLDDGPPLSFVVGKAQVTAGLEQAVLRLCAGDTARITCAPAMAYGDAGNPPYVPPRAYVVYDVTVRSVTALGAAASQEALPSGPCQLLGAGLANIRKESGLLVGSARPVTVRLTGVVGQDTEDDRIRRAAADMGIGGTGGRAGGGLGAIQEDEEGGTGAVAMYTYSQLLTAPAPPGVDAQHKERHLREADFESVMGRTRTAFESLSEAEQRSIKSSRGL